MPPRENLSLINISDTIPNFYSGKNILITGCTGFMGKTLLEKLLKTCPNIGTLYLLMRPSSRLTIQQKFDKIITNPLFDHVRTTNYTAFAKLRPVPGDVAKINLGMSDEDREEIVENVSVIFHVAASVRFDIRLDEGIIINVRGTREVSKLALELKHPAVFLHVSTGYSQIDKAVIEEELYPAKSDWREAIEVAENVDYNLLNVLSAKYLEGYPNVYSYTKSLAEHVVADICGGKVPTIILRPTIVMAAYKGSVPGWSDNFNGPLGTMIGMNKGVIRSYYIRRNVKYDYIPVDDVINSMIKAVWIQQYLPECKVSVYNSSCHNLYELHIDKLMGYGAASMTPIVLKPFWHANLYTTESYAMHYINTMLFHVLPMFILDAHLWWSDEKTMFMKLQRKIYLATNAYEYFYMHEWTFRNEKCLHLDSYLADSDRLEFCSDLQDIDYKEYFFTMVKGMQKFLLKEDPAKKDVYIMKRKRMKYIHYGLKYLVIGLALWCLLRCWGIFD